MVSKLTARESQKGVLTDVGTTHCQRGGYENMESFVSTDWTKIFNFRIIILHIESSCLLVIRMP